ncbi:toxin YdaT family protein [Lelliottia nimipressuralis]
MKISPPIEAVAAELEAWALVDGWKTVSSLVAGEYQQRCSGDVLPVPDTEAGLRNAVQRLKRIYRGGGRYCDMATELLESVLAAMPAERRARLETPGDPVLLAAVAAKEGIEAVNAVNLGAGPAVALKEINEAIDAFAAIKRAVERRWLTDVQTHRGSYA